jgi:hypothetical protein
MDAIEHLQFLMLQALIENDCRQACSEQTLISNEADYPNFSTFQ